MGSYARIDKSTTCRFMSLVYTWRFMATYNPIDKSTSDLLIKGPRKLIRTGLIGVKSTLNQVTYTMRPLLRVLGGGVCGELRANHYPKP